MKRRLELIVDVDDDGTIDILRSENNKPVFTLDELITIYTCVLNGMKHIRSEREATP